MTEPKRVAKPKNQASLKDELNEVANRSSTAEGQNLKRASIPRSKKGANLSKKPAQKSEETTDPGYDALFEKWDEEEVKSMNVVKKGGAQIVDVDKASFQAVMSPVYDKFMNTPDLKRMVKAVQDTK